MKLLKNRKFVILITVVIVILATMFGVYRTSARYTREIENMFYDGVFLKSEGYVEQSINTHLENCANASLGLATIMENYPELASGAKDLLSSRRDLFAAGSIKEKSVAFSEMRELFIELLENSMLVELSMRDMEAASQYLSTFNGAFIAIASSSYNDRAIEYLDGRSALMRIIGLLVPVKEPELFKVI